ncbi:MAG: hypothetical protein LBK94_08815 [Prevotellaceae bacterium]|jgi:hypothetical protein|nr:hypothetical protein [Prevotellaceae bacterium]
MKTFYKLVKILLAALFICLILDACASRYSGGRYRPRKSKNCDCPAYSYNIMQNKIIFFAPEDPQKL